MCDSKPQRVMSLGQARPYLRPSRHSQCFEGRCQTWSSAPPAAAERQQDTSVGRASQADGRHITVRALHALEALTCGAFFGSRTHTSAAQVSQHAMPWVAEQWQIHSQALHSHRDHFLICRSATDRCTYSPACAGLAPLHVQNYQEGKETYGAPVPCFPECKWREQCSWPLP